MNNELTIDWFDGKSYDSIKVNLKASAINWKALRQFVFHTKWQFEPQETGFVIYFYVSLYIIDQFVMDIMAKYCSVIKKKRVEKKKGLKSQFNHYIENIQNWKYSLNSTVYWEGAAYRILLQYIDCQPKQGIQQKRIGTTIYNKKNTTVIKKWGRTLKMYSHKSPNAK